eukprot:13252008-Ditylum_brightwellii.AAC.1
MGRVHLHSKLSNHTSQQNHGKTSYQENINNPLGKTSKLSTSNRGTCHVDTEGNENNHELVILNSKTKYIKINQAHPSKNAWRLWHKANKIWSS